MDAPRAKTRVSREGLGLELTALSRVTEVTVAGVWGGGARLEGWGWEGSRETLGPRPAGYVAPLSQAQRCLSPAGAHRGTGEPGVNRQGRIWLCLPGTSQELGRRSGGQDRELVSDPRWGSGPGGWAGEEGPLCRGAGPEGGGKDLSGAELTAPLS